MPDVSVIIVNYNGFDLLDKCIETLVWFTKCKYEIIVVDNGSSSGDVTLITSKYDEVKTIKLTENKGFAGANNIGFNIATGKYLLLLNNDIVFIEDAISKSIEYSKTIDDTAIIGCKLLNEDGSHQISIVDFDTLSNLFGENYFLYKVFPNGKYFSKYHRNLELGEVPIEVDVVKGAYFLIPRKVLNKVGLLDEKFFFYYEETEYCYRYKNLGGKVIYFPQASIIHLGGSSSDTNFWFKFYNQHVAKVKYFQKHFYSMKFILACIIHYSGLMLRVPIYFTLGIIKINPLYLDKAWCYLKTFFIYPKNQFKVS